MRIWKQRLIGLMISVMAMSMLCVSTFAAEGDPASSGASGTSATVISAFEAGFKSMASDAMSMIAVIVPIAVGVAGVIFLARKAMSWFKAISK